MADNGDLPLLTRPQGVFICVLYFVIWLAIGTFWPYVYVYYRGSLGLTGTQIGLVVMASSGVGMLSASAWGMVNDRVGRVRVLLAVASLGAVLVCQVLARMHTFAGVLLTTGCFSFFTSPIMPLLDSTTLKMLGPQRERYGFYRLWGTVGFIIGVTVFGLLMKQTGIHIIFTGYSLGVLLFGLIVLRLPDQRVETGRMTLAGLGQMLARPSWRYFAGSVFLLWFSVMGAFAFIGIIIKEMGGTDQMVGLNSTVAAISEIPLLFYSAWMLKRFGPVSLLSFAMGVYAARMFLYAFTPGVEWFPRLAVLQGPSYDPFLVGSVAYAHELAPAEYKATSQGLLVSTMSLANLTAGLAGGWLFDNVGKTAMYLVFGVGCLLALAVFGVGQIRYRAAASAQPT
jgi:MFS transporter, PPP family, 3-phenylpropionic acid transporter